MKRTRTLLTLGVFFLATASSALSLAQQQPLATPQAGNNSSQVLLASYDNSKVLLEQGSPEFILWDTSLCKSVETCPETLTTKLANIYEEDAFNNKVPHRAASDILDVQRGGWSSTRLPIGSPAVDAMEAYYRVPYKQSVPTCDGMLSQPSALGGGIILELFVVSNVTNVTTSTGNKLTTLWNNTIKTELIPGNVKWNIRVDKWPFCGSTDKLHLDITMRAGAAATTTTMNNNNNNNNKSSSQISSSSSSLPSPNKGTGIKIKSYEQVATDLAMESDLMNAVLTREVMSPPSEVVVFEGQPVPSPAMSPPSEVGEIQQQQTGGRKLKTAPQPRPLC